MVRLSRDNSSIFQTYLEKLRQYQHKLEQSVPYSDVYNLVVKLSFVCKSILNRVFKISRKISICLLLNFHFDFSLSNRNDFWMKMLKDTHTVTSRLLQDRGNENHFPAMQCHFKLLDKWFQVQLFRNYSMYIFAVK